MNMIVAATSTSGWGSILILIPIYLIVIWFFLMRPQKKARQKMQTMLSTMEVGDTVLTTSGFYGVIVDIADEETVIVEFGNNKNCRIAMQKAAISQIEKPEASEA